MSLSIRSCPVRIIGRKSVSYPRENKRAILGVSDIKNKHKIVRQHIWVNVKNVVNFKILTFQVWYLRNQRCHSFPAVELPMG